MLKENTPEWKNEDDMLTHFESIMPPNSVRLETPSTFYMDSPDNTDNAWKEVKVYHFRFLSNRIYDDIFALTNQAQTSSTESNSSSNVSIQKSMLWCLSTEDLLVRLPMEQVSFMNAIIRNISEYKTATIKDI